MNGHYARGKAVKQHMKKKIGLFAGGVGVLILVFAGYLYVQWRSTHVLFSETLPTSTPVVELETVEPEAEIESFDIQGSSDPLPSTSSQEESSSSSSSQEDEPMIDSEPTENTDYSTDTPVVDDPEQPTTSPTLSEADLLIADAIDTLSAYESAFLASLDSLYVSAVADYQALPEEEQTKSNRDGIMLDYAIKGLTLEEECDVLVDTLLSELTAALEAIGEPTDIVSTLQESYVEKKSEKQSEYLSILNS